MVCFVFQLCVCVVGGGGGGGTSSDSAAFPSSRFTISMKKKSNSPADDILPTGIDGTNDGCRVSRPGSWSHVSPPANVRQRLRSPCAPRHPPTPTPPKKARSSATQERVERAYHHFKRVLLRRGTQYRRRRQQHRPRPGVRVAVHARSLTSGQPVNLGVCRRTQQAKMYEGIDRNVLITILVPS